MKRYINDKTKMIETITLENPNRLSIQDVADKVGLSYATVRSYVLSFDLPVKRKWLKYSPEQIAFVKSNARILRPAELARKLDLSLYKVYDLSAKNGIKLLVRKKKQEPKSKFFQHDNFYKF